MGQLSSGKQHSKREYETTPRSGKVTNVHVRQQPVGFHVAAAALSRYSSRKAYEVGRLQALTGADMGLTVQAAMNVMGCVGFGRWKCGWVAIRRAELTSQRPQSNRTTCCKKNHQFKWQDHEPWQRGTM